MLGNEHACLNLAACSQEHMFYIVNSYMVLSNLSAPLHVREHQHPYADMVARTFSANAD